jgi:glycine/D-amino acid oxidase-like deaminating enzyme
MNNVVAVDIAIIGGGIAGLWLLARLRKRGYSVLLIESERLGDGQTICSQGIIHGGTKYSLRGHLSESAQMLSEMPALWRRCLHGEGEVDLRGSLLVEHQYLLATRAPRSWLAALMASKLMPDRMEKVAATNEKDYPPVLRQGPFKGTVYRLDEPIVDVASVLAALAEQNREVMVRCQGPAVPSADGAITLRHPKDPPLVIRPVCTVFAAGAGNSGLPWVAQQVRPLHMVLVRGSGLPGSLFGHFVGKSDMPRLTITTHCDANGELVWYLGGQLAEEGVKRNRQEQIRVTKRELGALLPWVDCSRLQFASFMIKRVEPQQPGGRRPVGPGVFRDGRMLVIWPTKLALAPLLAEQVEQVLPSLNIRPKRADLPLLKNWPRPEVAIYPWNREEMQWSS